MSYGGVCKSLFLALCLFGHESLRTDALASSCDKALAQQRFFSEYSIAKAIEELGGTDGRIFSAVIRGFDYQAIAKHFSTTVEYVNETALRGIDIVWKYKKDGL